MAERQSEVTLEDIVAAALRGVDRAVAARAQATSDEAVRMPWDIIIGLILGPEGSFRRVEPISRESSSA